MAEARLEPLPADKAIDLYNALIAARQLQLQPALARVVRAVGITALDGELHRLVPQQALSQVASHGLRGELIFPVPSVIRQAPPLLGYYRMLLGLSKKQFSQLGYARWVKVEESGFLSDVLASELEGLCSAFINPLVQLADAMGDFTERDLADLALLTLGPSLQGSRNTAIGSTAIRRVFEAMRGLLEPWITSETPYQIVHFSMPNGQVFQLVASGDPDLRIDALAGTAIEPRLAIEVKGGTDPSNVHNRTGEAEKSQIKARAAGYDQRWTIIDLRKVTRDRIMAQTPTSTRVYDARDIMQQSGPDWERFRHDVGMVVGQADL